MKNLALRMVLARIFILMLPVAAFGQQTAMEANVQNAGTYNDRGRAKQMKGDLDGAMADYNQAIKLSPNYALAYNNRGNVRKKKGDLNGAMADFNRPRLIVRSRCCAHRKEVLQRSEQEGAESTFVRVDLS